MYSIILGAVLGLPIAYLVVRRGLDDDVGLVGSSIILAIVGGIFGALFALFGSVLLTTHRGEVGRYDLVAMRTVDSTGGVFVWGTGSVGSSTVYRVMILNKDGSMSPFQADAYNSNTTIVEDDNLQDRGVLVMRSNMYDEGQWLYNWVFHMAPAAYSYEYRVPKGTVRNTFDAR